MGGIFQADAILKTMMELGLADLRANLWLLDHMLESYTKNPYLKDKYGKRQIDAAKEFLLNNKIEINVGYMGDKMKTPCVSIILGSQEERPEMKHMSDSSTESVLLMPNQIGKPIPYVVKPFDVLEYDESTGEVTIDSSVDLSSVVPGQILVSPSSGLGYAILEVTDTGVTIEANVELDGSQLGILPQYQYYKARIEHIFATGSYTILCTAHGDPQNVLWLHDFVLYSLLRYKESLLEANGLSETVISSGPLTLNPDITTDGAQFGWDRVITVTGQIETEFIKAPRRFIESVALKKKVPDTCDTYIGGIRIMSNLDTPDIIDESTQPWTTIEENENTDD
ncbi:conserved hypothetical protein [Azospirillaceae bacterium]